MSPDTKKKLLWIVAGELITGVIAMGFGWYARGPDPMSEQMRMCSAVTDCMAVHPNKIDMTFSCGNALYKLKEAHDTAKAQKAKEK